MHRADAGNPPLRLCATLTIAAQRYSEVLLDWGELNHTGPDGSEPWDRAIAAGYTDPDATGENIASGYVNVDEVMEGWMNSPGHRDNIVEPMFTDIGFGCADSPTSNTAPYWVQKFGDGGTLKSTPTRLDAADEADITVKRVSDPSERGQLRIALTPFDPTDVSLWDVRCLRQLPLRDREFRSTCSELFAKPERDPMSPIKVLLDNRDESPRVLAPGLTDRCHHLFVLLRHLATPSPGDMSCHITVPFHTREPKGWLVPLMW
jgi:hypothetical protein